VGAMGEEEEQQRHTQQTALIPSTDSGDT